MRSFGLTGLFGEPRDLVAFTVNGSASNSGTCDKSTVAERMMFATGVAGCDLRPTTEFADPDNQSIVQHAAISEICQHGGKSHVGRRNQIVLQSLEVVAVRVPEALAIIVPVDTNIRHSELQQSPSHQHALTVDVATVTISRFR